VVEQPKPTLKRWPKMTGAIRRVAERRRRVLGVLPALVHLRH